MFRKAVLTDLPAVERIYDEIHTLEETGAQTIGWIRGVYPVRSTAEAALERGDLYVLISEAGIRGAAGGRNQLPRYCARERGKRVA